MQCLEASELLSLRLDQPLAAEQERVLMAHVTDCQGCCKEWQTMERVNTLFDRVSLALPPPQMTERIMARIREQDRRRAAWKQGILLSAGLIVALLVGSLICMGIYSLVVNVLNGTPLVRTLAESIAHAILVASTVLEASAICLRALLASPTWLVVVGYLIVAGALLVGWTRLVMRPYRAVAQRQESR